MIIFLFNIFSLREYRIKYLKLLWLIRSVPIRFWGDYDGACIGIDNMNGRANIYIGESYRNKSYEVILHEIGHYIDFKVGNLIVPRMDYSRTKIVIDEISAWENALVLADKFNIPIDLEFSQKCINSYGASMVQFKEK